MADVTLTIEDDGGNTELLIDQVLEVQLYGQPGTGYSWHVELEYEDFPIVETEANPVPPWFFWTEYIWRYRPVEQVNMFQTYQLRYNYYRDWLGPSDSKQLFTNTVVVRQPSTVQISADVSVCPQAATDVAMRTEAPAATVRDEQLQASSTVQLPSAGAATLVAEAPAESTIQRQDAPQSTVEASTSTASSEANAGK
jgi:predicted secreted protein